MRGSIWVFNDPSWLRSPICSEKWLPRGNLILGHNKHPGGCGQTKLTKKWKCAVGVRWWKAEKCGQMWLAVVAALAPRVYLPDKSQGRDTATSLNWRTGQSQSREMRGEVGEMMQKKMRFQINEIGEIETLYGFSDPFSVTGGGLLSHSSDSGDNEITALWTVAGGINKSKLISPAPKTQGNLFQGLSVVLRAESMERLPPKALIHGAIWQRWTPSVKGKKGATWCQNRENRRFSSSYVLRGTTGRWNNEGEMQVPAATTGLFHVFPTGGGGWSPQRYVNRPPSKESCKEKHPNPLTIC